MNVVNPEWQAGIYLPAAPGERERLQFGIHVDGSPEEFIPRLRAIVAEVDPMAVLGTPSALDRVFQGDWYLMIVIAAGFVVLAGTLVALATSALYAMMSFSVSERTREIGIRAALGAQRARIVLVILKRSLLQIGVGVAFGTPAAGWLFQFVTAGSADGQAALPVALVIGTAVMSAVALVSCLAPASRVMAIQPAEALRTD